MIDVYAIANTVPVDYRASIITLLDRFRSKPIDEMVIDILDTSNPDDVPLRSINTHYHLWDRSIARTVTPSNPRSLIGLWIRIVTPQTEYPFVLMGPPTAPGTRVGSIVWDRNKASSQFNVPDTTTKSYRLYTGIGARAITGRESIELMELARTLADHRYLPSTGRAVGTDYVIEMGARQVWPSDELGPEIYLPYDGFNGADGKTDPWMIDSVRLPNYAIAEDMVRKNGGQGFKLAAYTRSVFEVLGADLNTPVDFVLTCADPKSRKSKEVKGGTNCAIRIALDHEIPIYNLRTLPFEELFSLISTMRVK